MLSNFCQKSIFPSPPPVSVTSSVFRQKRNSLEPSYPISAARDNLTASPKIDRWNTLQCQLVFELPAPALNRNLIRCLHDRANIEQTSSKHRAGSSRPIGTPLLAQM